MDDFALANLAILRDRIAAAQSRYNETNTDADFLAYADAIEDYQNERDAA
jgi:hypothetical protein